MNNVKFNFEEYSSKFTYHPDCLVRNTGHKGITSAQILKGYMSKSEVIALYDINTFTLSDLQIIKIIADNTFCTDNMLLSLLGMYRDNIENKKLAIYQDNNEISLLRSRLKILCKYLLISKFEFYPKTNTKESMTYYTVMPHGYHFIKNVLNYTERYDEYVAITPIEEVFSYLSTVNVCLYCKENVANFISYKTDKQEYIKSLQSKNKFHGQIKFTSEGKKPVRLIIESPRYRFNEFRITETDWLNQIIYRFKSLNYYLENQIKRGEEETNILFVCEDMRGIQNTVKIVKRYIPNYIHRILYTIDEAFVQIGVTHSILKEKDDKLDFFTPEFIKS